MEILLHLFLVLALVLGASEWKSHTLVGRKNNWVDNRVNSRSNLDMMGRRKAAAQHGTKPVSSVCVTVSVLACLLEMCCLTFSTDNGSSKLLLTQIILIN